MFTWKKRLGELKEKDQSQNKSFTLQKRFGELEGKGKSQNKDVSFKEMVRWENLKTKTFPYQIKRMLNWKKEINLHTKTFMP